MSTGALIAWADFSTGAKSGAEIVDPGKDILLDRFTGSPFVRCEMPTGEHASEVVTVEEFVDKYSDGDPSQPFRIVLSDGFQDF